MSANIQVMGRPREAGGLKESIAKFTKHHAEVGDALLNVSGIGVPEGQVLDENDPRPAYDPRDPANKWPLMVYHAERGELTVLDAEELKEARRQGYRDDPYPKPQIAVLDPASEKKALEIQLRQKDGEIALLSDTTQKLMERLEALEAAQFDAGNKKK